MSSLLSGSRPLPQPPKQDARERFPKAPHDRCSTMNPSSLPAESEPTPPPKSAPAAPVATEPRWSAEHLLQGAKEAIIVHGELVYRLRLTRSGKLILYK